MLRIAPTEDRKTIRDAYSRLLKALDPDAATEAFMELREARDGALSGHFLHPPRDADDAADEDDFGLGDPLPEGTTPPPAEPEPAERPQFTVEYSDEDDKRFQRMVELFTGEGDLAASEIEELHAHLDALFADDRMADLGHYARVEAWLAQLLADRYPRGAALFPRVAEHFHWGARAHELGIHPAIPWLFNAHEGHSLAHELGTPGHAYHREWVELVRGKVKGPLWLRAVDKQRMANLIATIRRDYPWLEQEHWQPDLVARWEKKVEGGGVSGPSPWVWILLGVVLFATLGRMVGDDSDKAFSSTEEVVRHYSNIESAELAISAFLDRRFAGSDVNVASLRERNPAFFEEMENVWDIYKAEPVSFENELIEMTTETYFLNLPQLSYSLLLDEVKYRQSVLDILKTDPRRCADFLRNAHDFIIRKDNSKDIPQDYFNHMLRVIRDDIPAPGRIPVMSIDPASRAALSRISASTVLPASILEQALTNPNTSDVGLCTSILVIYRHLPDVSEAEQQKLIVASLQNKQ
ncbi:MAG TPA: hypothetical protein PKC77_04885 [Sphingopyxis sp.]|nr:hypothetical protein [Sphingopyxis sp.]